MQPLALDWRFLAVCFEKIGLAWLLVLPTGWWSEKQGNSVGIRTFPLVAMASCGFLMILDNVNGDGSRVLQGLVTGIGFVGGGAIVRTASTCVEPRPQRYLGCGRNRRGCGAGAS